MGYLLAYYLDGLVLLALVAAALFADRQVRLDRPAVTASVTAAVLVTAHGALAGVLAARGWWFGQNAVLLGVPLVVAPALVALLVSRRRGPAVGVALQALAVGAVLAAVVTFFPPVPPLGDDAALFAVVFAAAVALLWGSAVHRLGSRVAAATGLAAVLTLTAGLVWGAVASGTPGRVTMAGHHHGGHGTTVDTLRETDLTGPARRFTLTAAPIPGRPDVWAFNGTTPGPELRVDLGDLVEVTLVNAGIETGVTLHWHGVDVPNAEDGVAGVTQDAVRVGARHTYRFRADRVGSYWYHSHQMSSEQVRKGLFGALVVAAPDAVAGTDVTLLSHAWSDGSRTLGARAGETVHRVPPGTQVRARLVNTDSTTARFGVAGTPFRVLAIDGHDVTDPAPLSRTSLVVGAGGRYDVGFVQPPRPVRIGSPGDTTSAVFAPGGSGAAPAIAEAPVLDPTSYGRAAPPAFDPARADRDFTVLIDQRPGFVGHRPTRVWTVNGKRFPDVPPFTVSEGDLVRVTVVNRGPADHPMHLHGHHVTVLSRNGRPVTGSPLSLDTVNVEPGEVWEVAFRADNPGVWMDHCHNLDHAATGMVVHLNYEGVTSPFEVGTDSGNLPE